MATEIKVPVLGESVSEATVAQWMKKVGEAVTADEPLVELETDKVTLEVNAPASGKLDSIDAEEGATVEVGALLGKIAEGAAGGPAKEEAKEEAKTAEAPKEEAKQDAPKADPPKPAPTPSASTAPQQGGTQQGGTQQGGTYDKPLSPAVRKLIEENHLDPAQIPASGKDGRLTKGDVLEALDKGIGKRSYGGGGAGGAQLAPANAAPKPPREDRENEERVRMSRLRQRIAERLKEAQNTAAMLTTFNEVDMTNLMAMRNKFKDAFEKKHGVKLGFMSLFAKAAVNALQELPAVNAEIDGTDIIYKNYYDIGVAVGTPQGLVVPVVRDCDSKSHADIEKDILDYGTRAREGKLKMEEMAGGTFTISNGGVYGSLMSTPILNPPQSAIMGMHKTQMRPVAVGDKVEIRPMMYLALSYDHRIIDGKEAVTFLVRVKEVLEDPERLLLGV